jgi:carbamoyl-phosphate synthase large subunit
MKVNVLVTAAGGTVGQGIIKSLKLSRLDFKIVACDAQPYAAGLYRVNKSYIVPTGDSAGFIDKVITLCNKENIHAILIGTIYELEAFAKHKKK